MEILGSDEAADIISWLPHGKGFLIYKKKKFATDILPKFFKQSKYTSFTRKLNRWGFIRVTRGPETGAYYHKLFQRGDFLLCMQMCCQTTKPTTSSLIFDDQLSINVSNDYSSQTHSAVDLVQQSQDMIRRQLQHLQFQQREFMYGLCGFLWFLCLRMSCSHFCVHSTTSATAIPTATATATSCCGITEGSICQRRQ